MVALPIQMFTGAVVVVAVALHIADGRDGVGSSAHGIRVAEAVLKLDLVLVPVSSQNSLDLSIEEAENGSHQQTLVVHQDVHHIVIHLLSDLAFWSPWEQHKLDAKQRNQNQGGSHCFHVQVGFCLVGVFQLGYENTNDIQQEEKIHQQRSTDRAVDDVQEMSIGADPAIVIII